MRSAVRFALVLGDLCINGRYSITGKTRDTVTKRHPPEVSDLSWEFGEIIGALRVHLKNTEDDDDRTTTLEVMHTFPVDGHWNKYGPGAGVGLALHLTGLPKPSLEE